MDVPPASVPVDIDDVTRCHTDCFYPFPFLVGRVALMMVRTDELDDDDLDDGGQERGAHLVLCVGCCDGVDGVCHAGYGCMWTVLLSVVAIPSRLGKPRS